MDDGRLADVLDRHSLVPLCDDGWWEHPATPMVNAILELDLADVDDDPAEQEDAVGLRRQRMIDEQAALPSNVAHVTAGLLALCGQRPRFEAVFHRLALCAAPAHLVHVDVELVDRLHATYAVLLPPDVTATFMLRWMDALGDATVLSLWTGLNEPWLTRLVPRVLGHPPQPSSPTTTTATTTLQRRLRADAALAQQRQPKLRAWLPPYLVVGWCDDTIPDDDA